MTLQNKSLKRSITLPFLTLYGLGTIMGAGIFVLIGKVAGLAGLYAPIAYLIAAIVAGFTAFSYAELATRFPKSAGESVYVYEAFHISSLSALIGWLVVLTGVVSAATMTRGLVGYIQIFINLDATVIMLLKVSILTAIAIWGIKESILVATIVTIIQILGLIFLLVNAREYLFTLPARWTELVPNGSTDVWLGIFLGVFLAFYAFIGFEDMVNVVEEVKQPKQSMPLAIILALIIATFFYVIVAITAVLAVSPKVLANSTAPFATILEYKGGHYPAIISLISLVAVVNSALAQLIMASRVIYGMSAQNIGPKVLANINQITQTPIMATILAGMLILLFALWLPLVVLAKLTSFIILGVFLLVNIALVWVKKTDVQPVAGPCYAMQVPIIGAVLCLALMILQIYAVTIGVVGSH